MSDVQIIRAFFESNDMEEEGMELIHKLTKSKVEKLNRRKRMVEEWASYLPSKYLYENYDLETADFLHKLELDYLAHGGELSHNRFELAKERIPNIKIPDVYFRPLIEYLDSKDIRFKGEKPIENRFFMYHI